MPESQLHFVVPLPFAWTDTKQPDSVAEITFTPADGTPFEFTPMGGVLGDNGSAFSENTVQWRVKHGGTVPVTTSLKQAGQSTTATLSVQFAEPRPLEIDFAEVQQADGGKRHVLLRGSVRIPLSLNAQDLSDDFQKSLAALWPVAGDQQIVALRLEPAGLYLEGKLPAAMFPRGIAADGEVTVVLRVPQQEWDTASGKRFWTLESFDFGNELPSAREFLLGYAEDLDGFNKPDRKTFIDNVAASPVAETAVRISRLTDDELVWAVSGSRVLQPKADELKRELPALRQQLRIQFGGGEAGEAAFHPDELTGKVKENNGAWKRIPFGANGGEGHHVLVRTKRTEAEPAAESAVALGMSSDTPKLVLTQQKLAALSLPSLPLKPPVRDDAQPDDKPPAQGRSWLCTDQGWLAVDAAPAPKGAGAGGGRGAGAIQGVIELEKIMAYLKEPPEQGGVGGQQAGQAVAEEESRAQETLPDALLVQLATLDTTSVVLGIDYDDQTTMVGGVHLFLGDPLTTVITPSVWYAAPSSDQAASTAELLPALSVAQDASPLESMFQKASFISPQPGNSTPSVGITAEIAWEKTNNHEPHFRLKLQAAQLRLWHPIPNVPLAQSFSRTPDPSRDSTLDANRGLLPFELADNTVTLEFFDLPADDLPSVAGAPESRDNFGAWAISASQFPTRYFLPTLPGVEATLPVKPKSNGDEPEQGLRWGYRHAVPALDEAYAEVVEDPAQKVDAVQTQGALDFTRVEGAEAFEISKGVTLATGWRLKSEDNPTGTTAIKIADFEKDFKPDGRVPHLQISLDSFSPDTITFSRTENKEEHKTVAGLTGEFANGQRIANEGQSLGIDGTTTRDGEGLATFEILNIPETQFQRLGQPEPETRVTGRFVGEDGLALELMGVPLGSFDTNADDQGWLLHDGNGDWPSLHGWPLFPVKLQSLQKGDEGKLIAVIEAILLPRTPTPPVFALTRDMVQVGNPLWTKTALGTNLNGTFTLTIPEGEESKITIHLWSNRWPLYPPHISMSKDEKPMSISPGDWQRSGRSLITDIKTGAGVDTFPSGTYDISIYTDMPASSDGAPSFAAGKLNIELELWGIFDSLIVKRIVPEGSFDWRFGPQLGDDVSLLRLQGALGSPGDQLTLTGLALKHPLGVINLSGDRIEKGINLPAGDQPGLIEVSNRRSLNPESLNPCDHVDLFDYRIKLEHVEDSDGDPYSITECVFAWTFDDEDTTVRLTYATAQADQWFPGCPWWVCVCRKTLDGQYGALVAPLCLEEPQMVDQNRFLFNVAKKDEYEGIGGLRLKTGEVVGVVGIKFSEDRLTIESLTADIQVSMKDRHPDDLIVLWDPVRDVLHSIDRNVGTLPKDDPLIGPAGKQLVRNSRVQEELFWADGRGQLRRWRSGDENSVFEFEELHLLGQIVALAAAKPTEDKLLGIFRGKDRNGVVEVDILDEAGAPQQEGPERPKISSILGLDGLDPSDQGKPITAVATCQPAIDKESFAWAQGQTVLFKERLDGDQTISVKVDAAMEALCISECRINDETLDVVVGVADGTLVCWKAQGNSLTKLTIPPVQARSVMTISGPNLAVADLRSELHLVNLNNLVAGSPENSRKLPTPAARLEDATLQAMVSLGRNELSNNRGLVSFATLYSGGNDHADAAVFVYEAAAGQLEGAKAWTVRQLETAECRPQRLSHLRQINGRKLLIIAGPTASSRLLVHVHISDKELRTEVTGRLTIQNNLDYVISDPDQPLVTPHCTHRIDLYFDRAPMPAEAIFWGAHLSDQDVHTAALAHHVFRFPDGHERIWQAPQMVRFTSLERFAEIAGIDDVPVERKDDLVLDASAVFWLQPAIWAEAMRYGVGAAAIGNDDFRLWLLPRELRSFETGLARAVRLPAVACWAFDNAPFEVRAADALAAPRIEIREGDAASDLAYWTSGVQRLLEPPGLLHKDGRPTYFARGAEAAWLDAGFLQKRLHRPGGADQADDAEMPGIRPAFPSGTGSTTSLPPALNDLLWLKDQLGLWLHEHVRLYCLEHRADVEPADPITLLATISRQLGDWRTTQDGRNDPNNLDKFRGFLETSHLADGFAGWLKSKFDDPTYRAQYTDFIRGDSAFLASATLAHHHDPENVSQALDGPTLFEFPYRLRLEELSGKPDAGKKFDAQLLVLDKEGSLKRVAHAQLAPEVTAINGADGDQENGAANGMDADQDEVKNRAAQDRAAEKWAHGLMEQRRRYDAAFVLVNFARLIPVPRRFEAAYEDLPFSLDAPLGGAAEEAEAADPRRRLPGLQRLGETWQRTWLAADPDLGLRVFAAEPAVPDNDLEKSVAANRFRLARAGGTSHLAPALVEPAATAGDQATPAQPRIVALSRRDDVPFEVQMPNPPGLVSSYPLDEGRKLLGQPAPIPANLKSLRPSQGEGDGQPASLLPPLVDVVSWAARPGEMMRSSFSTNVYEYRGTVDDPSLQEIASSTRHPVAVSLRRPRARAGQQEAVRLRMKEDKSLPYGRFRQAEFVLQQDIERTSLGELGANNVQIVVVTRTDVFKSSADIDKARSNPAQVYSASGARVYLVTNQQFLSTLPQDDDENNHFVLRVFAADTKREQIATQESTKAYFNALPRGQSPDVLWHIGKAAFREENSVKLGFKDIELPETGSLLALVQYKQTPSLQPGEGPTPDQAILYAAVDVKVLIEAGKFIPPKMSISLLSWPKNSADETVTLAGYGRLGPEDFSLVEPRADSDGLAWMRTARLRVIHRSVPGENYDYDVVTYGPGGELIRTERFEIHSSQEVEHV